MVRGQRDGTLSKSALLERLKQVIPENAKIPATATLQVLIGHAVFYKLLSPKEIEETTPRDETTLPCYLWTYVTDAHHRSQIEAYVKVASRLYRRGSLILNILAQSVCGPRLPGATDVSVSVWRPPWSPSSPLMDSFRTMARLLEPVASSIERNTLKHAFLPERWPSRDVPRRPEVAAILTDPAYRDILPPAPSAWTEVMTSTGWDNAINRMMSKFCGNVKVHAMSNLAKDVLAYLNVVPMAPEAPRGLLIDAVHRPLRPLQVSNDDWAMVVDLRRVLMGDDLASSVDDKGHTRFINGYTPDKTSYSADVLILHLFLARYGTKDRTYLPVASRGRKYCYIDAKVARSLFAKTGGKASNDDAVSRSSGEDSSSSVCVGELLGLTPQRFNRSRRKLRRQIRRKKRRLRHRGTKEDRRKRKETRDRWARNGASYMPRGARIDSIETDGVGLRMVMKIKADISKYVVPVSSSDPQSSKDDLPRKRRSKKATNGSAEEGHEPAPATLYASQPPPVISGMDNGRAKLFMAAISRSASKKPQSMGFTRRRYYSEMGFRARQSWEAARMAQSPNIRAACDALSQSGGLKNCDPASWIAYLEVETLHRPMLDEEFVDNVERAKWAMRLHRNKKRSLDSACGRFMKAAAGEGPLVMGIGTGGFAPTGRGELPAPTAELTRALKRAIDRVRAKGRTVIILQIDEFRTTMCCCACGSVTNRPTVRRRKEDPRTGETTLQDGPSRRLRRCTTCDHAGKLRDRDVQGARNILWLTQAMYYGLPRPAYMCRGG